MLWCIMCRMLTWPYHIRKPPRLLRKGFSFIPPLMVLGPFFTFSRALRQMIKWLGANGHLALGKRLFAFRQYPDQISSDSLLNWFRFPIESVPIPCWTSSDSLLNRLPSSIQRARTCFYSKVMIWLAILVCCCGSEVQYAVFGGARGNFYS